MSRRRASTASATYEDVDRERKRVKAALKLAQKRAKRLAKEVKRTKKLARAAEDDRDDAETELAENHATRDKRRSKLAKAQAALAAAQACSRDKGAGGSCEEGDICEIEHRQETAGEEGRGHQEDSHEARRRDESDHLDHTHGCQAGFHQEVLAARCRGSRLTTSADV